MLESIAVARGTALRSFFTDHTIIARHACFAVLAQVLPVEFRDGRRIGLHQVQIDTGPGGLVDAMDLRAVVDDGLHAYVIDLRKVWPPLSEELIQTPPLDVDGHLYYTLRLNFENAAAFESAAIDCAEAVWRQEERVAA